MSDLDKEELEATRKMQSSAESAEKSADEMFEELGYEKVRDNIDCWCNYENNIHKISFEKNVKSIFFEDKDDTICLINLNVLQAINKKCYELGWLDE